MTDKIKWYKQQRVGAGRENTTAKKMYNCKPTRKTYPASQFEMDLSVGRAKCTLCGQSQMLEGTNKVEYKLSAKKFKQSHKCPDGTE